MTKRTTTKTTDTRRNGGIHSVRHYKAACKWIDNHTFSNAQLWHIVLYGSTDKASYQKALDRLLELLRDAGMRVEWRSAYEYDSEKESHKALHRHVFLMIEACTYKPFSVLNNKKGSDGLRAKLTKYGVNFYIAPPGDDLGIHGGQPFMYVPKKEGVKRHDCREWIAYIYKVRSKAGVVGTIYSASRNRATKAPEQPQAAKEAPMQATPLTNEEKGTMTSTALSKAAFIHIGTIYEQAVDAGMHLGDVQRHLAKNGIHKSMLAIKNDLNYSYCFHRYVETHPAPPLMSYAEVDAAMSRPARRIARSDLSHGQGQMSVPAMPIKAYQTHC